MNRCVAYGLRALLLGGVVSLTAACSLLGFGSSPFEYDIDVANYGTHGVILRDFHASRGGFGVDDRWGINPGFPGVPGDFKDFEHLVGYPHSLPDTLVVTWQLAELSNCESVYRSPNYKGYVRKEGCSWAPIEGKIFYQRIDIAAIRASEAYQRVGETSPRYTPYYLVIELIFNEDSLTVRTRNGSPSPI